jgi:hypothetical protein
MVALLASLRDGAAIPFRCNYCGHKWDASEIERKKIAAEIERRAAEKAEWATMSKMVKAAEVRKSGEESVEWVKSIQFLLSPGVKLATIAEILPTPHGQQVPAGRRTAQK